jgi:proteasome assembly chaperone (PAC2) family protein
VAKIIPPNFKGWRWGKAKGRVRFLSHPILRNPVMFAAWPGIGEVALIVGHYLKKLKVEEFAELEAFHFFEPGGVLVKNSIVETPHFPSGKFYYWRNPAGDGDLILFLGEEQPPAKAYELAGCLLDLAQRFKVKRIYTSAAALTRIHHMEKPKVWLVTTRQDLLNMASKYHLTKGGNIQIAGLNGLLLGAAKERGFDGLCLLGEVPIYATRMSHPKAALVVLEALARMLTLKVDTTELSDWAEKAQEEMKKLASEAMGEFIQQFTQPLWEQNQPEQEE